MAGPVALDVAGPGTIVGRARDLAGISEALKDPGKPARLILSGEPGNWQAHLETPMGQTSGHVPSVDLFVYAFNDDPALGLAKLTRAVGGETIADRATRRSGGSRSYSADLRRRPPERELSRGSHGRVAG